MRPSRLRVWSHRAWFLLDGNDDASDTAESRLHAQQMLIMVVIMCFSSTRGKRNQIMTRKPLHQKSYGDNDVAKASLSPINRIQLYSPHSCTRYMQ